MCRRCSPLAGDRADLIIRSDGEIDRSIVCTGNEEVYMGCVQTMFLANEVPIHLSRAMLDRFALREGESPFDALMTRFDFPDTCCS